jgi:hypothetical protein
MHEWGHCLTNRREFLHGALTVALTLPAGVPLRPTGTLVAAPRLRPLVLIDDRHPEARIFAAALAGRGMSVHTMPDGDVSAPWREWIGPAWRRAPALVAGLTQAPALFCLEQLGWSLGGRVVFYAEHLVSAARSARHKIIRMASADQVAAEEELSMRRHFWPGHLAFLVAAHSAVAQHPRVAPTHIDLALSLPGDAQRLTSWIIAQA